MGWSNPDVSWSELEAALSGRAGSSLTGGPEADGGDSPAWSRKREPYRAADPPALDRGPRVPYAELHCHSNFSFLDGASHPEELVEEAARLGLDALALTDHDGIYGVVRFAEAAAELDVATVFGAELSLGLSAPQNGVADPEGTHLLLLARDPEGYRGLCRTISAAQLARRRRRAARSTTWTSSSRDTAGPRARAHRLPQGRGPAGAGPRGARCRGRRAAAACASGSGRTTWPSSSPTRALPTDTERNDALAALAADAGLPMVATTAAHYAAPERLPLATALAAVRARRSLDEIDGWLPPAGTAHLRSGAEMAARFDTRYPGAVARAAAFGRRVRVPIRLVAPELPPFPVPPGHTEMTWLRELTWRGARSATAARRVPRGRRTRSTTSWRSSRRRASPATS